MTVSILRQTKEVITLTAQEICQACSGELLTGTESTLIEDVSTDTRAGLAGSLFVALKGEHFDGGDFVTEALAQGAVGVVAESSAARRLAAAVTASGNGAGSGGQVADPVIIAVADTGQALKDIASLVYERSSALVVAITGSTGKTSTKDILFNLLDSRLNTVASKASFNNEVGVPLTMLSLTGNTQVAVVEMGMQAPGEIAKLCRVAPPHIAIITNIGPAHLEFAGDLHNIARGKAEIAQGLPPDGGLVVPYGEKLLEPYILGLKTRIITFGFNPAADIHVVDHEHLKDGSLCCRLSCLGEEIDLCFNFTAKHHLLNAMAAIGAYRLLDQPLAAAATVAGDLHLPKMRGETLQLLSGGILINDCYNANPLSMRSSLEHLASTGAGRRTVAVLGDMGELGPRSPEFHREVGGVVHKLGVDCLIGIGKLAAGYIEGAREAESVTAGGSRCKAGGAREYHYFADRETALKQVPGLIRAGDVVLVKASRFMRLEQLSDVLAGASETGAAASSPPES